MLGLFRKRRINKAVQAAHRGLQDGALDASAMDGLDDRDRAEAWAQLAELLMDEGEEEGQLREVLERALEFDPESWDSWACLAQLEQQTEGRAAEAMAAYEKLTTLDSSNEAVRLELVFLLLENDRAAEALESYKQLRDPIDMDQGLRLGTLLYGAGQLEPAIQVLGDLRKQSELALRQATLVDNFEAIKQVYEASGQLHDEAYAEVHGREATIQVHAENADLDARAGVNYQLLGESLMVEAPRLARSLRLTTPQQEQELAEELLEEGARSHGLTLRGSSLLRTGDAARALDEFEQACEADGKNFAAFLGLGAAMEAETLESHRRVMGLPEFEPIPHLERVVPDDPVLTRMEADIVRASAFPLRACLGPLAEAGVTIRLLPVDVRPTDLPEFAGEQDRTDDHRTLEAIGGLASERLAVARVLDLVNIDHEGGWTFAHELAHLAFFHISEEVQDIFKELHRDALDVGYVVDTYAAQNLDEFFAGTYVDYLRHRYDCRHQKELDDEGVLRDVYAAFDEISNAGD